VKLHRLVLTNYKGVEEREVAFPDSGVIVLQGPNEIGKTSMLEALDLLLEEKDSSRKRQVEAVRPVGKDVPTAIEAEISSGPYRFTYRKQWFRKPSTELRITAPRMEQLVGVAAHDRVARILEETSDTDLWKALRLLQATPLVQEDLSGSSALGDALDRAAGQAGAAGADGETLLESVEAEYGRYFTLRAGAPTGTYKAHQREAALAAEAAAAAQADLDAVQQDVDSHARAEEELARCERELVRAEADRTALDAQWSRIVELQRGAEAARTTTRLADLEHQGAVTRWGERRRQVEESERLAMSARELAGEVDTLGEECGRREQALAELEAAQVAAESAERSAREAHELAKRDQAHLREVEVRRTLEARLREIEDAAARREEAQARLAGLVVDRALWGRIERADRALESARLEQRAASARLSVTALADGQVLEIDGERRDLGAGDLVEPALGEALEIVVPGALRFTFRPEAGAGERAAAVADAETRLIDLLGEVGAVDVAEARDRHAERLAAEEEMRAATAAHQILLRGEDLGELRERWQAAVDSVTAHVGLRPGGTPLAEDHLAAQAQVDRTWMAHERSRDAATEAQRAVDVARTELVGVRQRLEGSDTRHQEASRRLAEVRAALDEARLTNPDAALEDAVGAATAAVERARSAEAEAVRQLEAQDPERVRGERETAEASVRSWTERRRVQAEERASIRGRLEKVGSAGLQEACDAALSRLEHAQRELAAADRRARAAKLLRETLLRRRAAAQQAYAAPFAEAVNRLGRVVYDQGFEVEVDDQLRVVSRLLDGRVIPFEALSTGAKEQLAVLTRLACAGLVDGQQGVPVVIDDALGYSDPDRLRRICAAFNVLEHDSQVILLTCTPGRYADIRGAEFVTLS